MGHHLRKGCASVALCTVITLEVPPAVDGLQLALFGGVTGSLLCQIHTARRSTKL